MKIEVFEYTDRGGRAENEDSVGCKVFDNGVVAAVTDGLGGQGDGKAASELVCNSLLENCTKSSIPDEDMLTKLFDYANRELISKQQNCAHMKTTAVFLLVGGRQAIWAHIGDSRLYHVWNGTICDYTLDHSAAQLAVYMGKITRDQIPNDPGQSRLLRAMGVEDEHPDIHAPILLEKGKHIFLLCSDGLWEYLRDTDLERTFFISDSPKEYIDYLRSLKENRSPENCDNHSAVAVFIEV